MPVCINAAPWLRKTFKINFAVSAWRYEVPPISFASRVRLLGKFQMYHSFKFAKLGGQFLDDLRISGLDPPPDRNFDDQKEFPVDVDLPAPLFSRPPWNERAVEGRKAAAKRRGKPSASSKPPPEPRHSKGEGTLFPALKTIWQWISGFNVDNLDLADKLAYCITPLFEHSISLTSPYSYSHRLRQWIQNRHEGDRSENYWIQLKHISHHHHTRPFCIRPNVNGSSMVRRRQKCWTPQVTRLASRNLAAQTCLKSGRLLIWERESSPNVTSSARPHLCRTPTADQSP